MSTDREREALARSVREKARSALCRATGPDLQGDNLGIALLTHISPAHPDEEHDDCGWPLSAVDAVNAIFDDAIANLLSAGWMPREALSDPNAVHINMLTGRIARPTPEQIVHIYGADVLARAALNTGAPEEKGQGMNDRTDEGPLIERLLQALDDAAATLDFLADVQPDEGMRATIRQKAQDARDAMRKVQIAREDQG